MKKKSIEWRERAYEDEMKRISKDESSKSSQLDDRSGRRH